MTKTIDPSQINSGKPLIESKQNFAPHANNTQSFKDSDGILQDAKIARNEGGSERTSRAFDVRSIQEDRVIQDPARRSMLRERRDILPNIKAEGALAGFHLIWLSTTNDVDPIPGRIQDGYVPVKPEEIPGHGEYYALKEGQYKGFIGVKEMLLFKLPEDLYQQYMRELHHEAPLQEEYSVTTEAVEKAKSIIGNSLLLSDRDDNGEFSGMKPEIRQAPRMFS